MNGTTHGQARSVQIAVMATPSASVAEAVAEARHRRETSGSSISHPAAMPSIRVQVAAT
jgi:hypothetical protein